jgi:predicted class III extradiol MEMO1 family dioxygenase
MRSRRWAGTRIWLVLPAGGLLVSGFVAGCSSGSSGSSKPAYCTAASQLSTSVQDLGSVNVSTDGVSSLQAALNTVQTDATAFATAAKSAYPSQTTALKSSLSSLQAAINSAKGQSLPSAARAVVPAVAQVKSSASTLESAVSGSCE